MWGRSRQTSEAKAAEASEPAPLKEAVRQTRIEMAEQTGVVVELRDAEVARLELLDDALDRPFSEIPAGVDLFDRGISRGETPRLWIDAVAHVAMARDKRCYRFLQDTRYGRKVLAESHDIPVIANAVTHYVAARLIERERALAGDTTSLHVPAQPPPRRGSRAVFAFLCGVAIGAVVLCAALWIAASRLPH